MAAVGAAPGRKALVERKDARDYIGNVRGEGLFIGIEMVRDRQGNGPDRDRAIAIVNHLKDKGFLTSNAGMFGNVVKIRPPLVFSHDNAEAFLKAWDETISEIDG